MYGNIGIKVKHAVTRNVQVPHFAAGKGSGTFLATLFLSGLPKQSVPFLCSRGCLALFLTLVPVLGIHLSSPLTCRHGYCSGNSRVLPFL